MLQQRQKNRKRRGGKKRTTDGLKGEEGEEEKISIEQLLLVGETSSNWESFRAMIARLFLSFSVGAVTSTKFESKSIHVDQKVKNDVSLCWTWMQKKIKNQFSFFPKISFKTFF